MVATSVRTASIPLTGGRLRAELNANGSLRSLGHGDVVLNLFVGNELEGGPANLYLRRRGAAVDHVELLGPRSPTRWLDQEGDTEVVGVGEALGLRWSLTLRLARDTLAWFWHVRIENVSANEVEIDLIYAQDIALAPYAAVRTNEYYVSQYVDHTLLKHPKRGQVIASRQNQAASGKNPWCVIGSLRRAVLYATDALQWHGLASRAGLTPEQVHKSLPGVRLQHEHSMVCLQDESARLAPGATLSAGFFGLMQEHHPAASGASDLAHVDEAVSLPEATPPDAVPPQTNAATRPVTGFSIGDLLEVQDLTEEEVTTLFDGVRRHEERDKHGTLLSFFYGADRHVVMREKERRVLRPHGHLLRTGLHLTPDESALTSTVWMSGVFNSMLTQGHVSINRALSTVRSYLGLFRSHGQRVFVEIDETWRLLDMPSAFEIAPDACRWLYRHAGGLIEIRSEARHDPHAMHLIIEVRSGDSTRFLITHHVALNGDDGAIPGPVHWRREGDRILMQPAPDSELGRRFPHGSFEISTSAPLEQLGGDELLFLDARSRHQPYICMVLAPTPYAEVAIQGRLVTDGQDVPAASLAVPESACGTTLTMTAPEGELAARVQRLADIVPWLVHNALIHYLSPRGLEQYSGGGWGTRDVSQGPVELLLALGNAAPVRDLLLRVFQAQSTSGDWPQWFMFFARERDIRAGDSHGDIVFWPLLALAQYLLATGDASLLEARVGFYEQSSGTGDSQPTVWEHVERALALIERRVISGTVLAAYGHGDWNDALQPADPAMREHMCSAWTVTLHYQMLHTLARALTLIGREREAERYEAWAHAIRDDFQRLLIKDGVLTGYALFEGGEVRYLLHPRDSASGVRYSALAMVHAILEDLLTPEQARQHLALIDEHLSGPDGLRLFDRPMQYHGGPQRFFQRAESATFFGREIGLMYMHAHLRYAQALAHVGEADQFFEALCQADPIGIREIVPPATLRQANCYYSSSDAVFRDRHEASEHYDKVKRGEIALEGGWRVYSSGAGIGLGLIVRRFLGLTIEAALVSVDPVIPPSLDGLQVEATLFGRPVTILYDVRPPGCGVTAVQVNGDELPLAFEKNPHRRGAARILKSALRERLVPAGNVLRISVG